MSAWLVIGLLALAAALMVYATANAGGSRSATDIVFHAVMPVSEPVAADGYLTLGPFRTGEHVFASQKAGQFQATLADGIVSVSSPTATWTAAAVALLDAAAGQPGAGGVPLEVPFERQDEEGSARALVYEVRGVAGGDVPRLDVAAFWLLVPASALPARQP
jgi:hypothetical protein